MCILGVMTAGVRLAVDRVVDFGPPAGDPVRAGEYRGGNVEETRYDN